MSKKLGLASVLLAGTVMAGGLSAIAADSLTIVSWGGAYSDSQREAFYKPYSKDTGTQIIEEEYNGELAKIRAMVEAGDVTWDVVDIDTQMGLQGCDEGIFEVLDYSKIVDTAKLVPGAQQECAVGNIVYSTIFAYDADKFPDGPKSWADFFDLEKFPGKRAMQKDAFGNLEFALSADGVPHDQIYDLLRTPEGVDRAFAKLATIKDQVVWWEAGAQAPQLLADGEVAMTTAWNGRIYGAVKNEGKNFKIVWDGQLPDFDLWAIPAGAKNLDASYAFLNYAMAAENMARQSQYISYGPTNVDALPAIPADILADLPTAPENMKNAIVLDAEFWGDNGEELRNRFNTWLAQ